MEKEKEYNNNEKEEQYQKQIEELQKILHEKEEENKKIQKEKDEEFNLTYLKKLNLTNFNTNKITNMSDLFCNCESFIRFI